MSERPLEHYAWMSIGAAVLTMALKTLAWWLTDSVGLLSDALESLVNLAAATLALWVLRVAASPPSAEHPFGLSKAEYFSAGIEGGLIVLAAAGIVLAALPRLAAPQPIEQPILGLLVNAVAGVVNLLAALRLIRVGRERHSVTLEADGHHLMSDVVTSAAVLGGVALAAVTGWLVLDPLLGLAMAAYIVWTGARLVTRSVRGLLDRAISLDERGVIDKIFAEYGNRYGMKFHAVRTRQAGTRRFVTFHMLVPDHWSVAQAHQLSEEIEERIRELVPNVHTLTHIEPISDPASYEDEPLDR